MTINRDLLRQRMKVLGYTRKGVARRAEISVHTLAKMLSGNYGVPNQYTRMRLARALEINEADLFPLARKEAS